MTIPSWAQEPLVDVDRLAAQLGGAARVFVMPTGESTWELTDRLPPRLDVYGGATRIWWPGVDPSGDPFTHPLFFVHDVSQSDDVIAQVLSAVRARAGSPVPAADPLAVGTETGAVVDAVHDWGVELTLQGGRTAFARPSELSKVPWLTPRQLLRRGQAVRVAVIAASEDTRRVAVSLRPFEPDPWQRLSDEYRVGMYVEGIVDELRNYGALVMLLPGVRGLVRKSRITDEWISHPEDVLSEGDCVVARIEEIDVTETRIDLSLRGVPTDAIPVDVIALYPDGPPWLEAIDPESEPVDSDEHEAPPAVAEDEQIGTAASMLDAPMDSGEPAGLETDSTELPIEASDAGDEQELLERAIEDGRELQRQFDDLFGETRKRLSQLRAEASQVRRGLETELVAVRRRILEVAESETAQLVGSTEEALEEARREAGRLREQLAAAEFDRRELLDRLKTERERAAEAGRRADRLRKELRGRDQVIASLETEVVATGATAEERWIGEVERAWERTTTSSDRSRYPWRVPTLGAEFLPSLDRVEGIARSRVADVCAHVVSGRAAELAGLELHALRQSEAANTGQRVRADGARAWRCNLQTGTPAARRLHYWELPGGAIELAKIVYHDDFTIR